MIKKLAWHWPKKYRVIFEDSSSFGHYINQLKSTENDKQLKQEYESQLVFVKEYTTEVDVLAKKMELEKTQDDLYDSVDEKTATRTAPALRTSCRQSGQHIEKE